MQHLIDSSQKSYIEHLNSVLRRYGIDSVVLSAGQDPQGKEIFAVACPQETQVSRARHLLFSDTQFINDITPEYANELRIRRNESLMTIGALLTSTTMLKVSGLALILVLLAYALGL